MNTKISQKENLLYRTLLALAMILLAAALRIAPHPWNFTPVGAMALFSGALLKDRRLAFVFPLVALFVGDIFIGFHKLLPIVYASFLVNVAIGLWLRDHRTIARISIATLLGAIQFFLVTNFAVWWLLNSYPKTVSGLAACYLAGIPSSGTRSPATPSTPRCSSVLTPSPNASSQHCVRPPSALPPDL